MLIINFSHPITEKQKKQIEELTGRQIEWLIDVPVQVAQDAALWPQVVEIVTKVELSSTEWQTEQVLVNLPGYAPVAACLLAEVEGRSGHLPSIIKIRPVPNSPVTEFEVAEIINLKNLRDEARTRR